MFLAFLRAKLACEEREFYVSSFSQSDFELSCPSAAAEFDRLTNSKSGEPKSSCLGQLGKWLYDLGQQQAIQAARAAKSQILT